MTVLAQIAAEALEVPLSVIQMAPVDTSRVPDSGPTVASRTTTVQGMAVLDAARKLKAKINLAIQEILGYPKFVVEGRTFRDLRDPKRRITLEEVARWMWTHNWDMGATGWAEAAPVDWDPKTGLGNAYFVYAFACHIAEVEVDLLTGETHVRGFWAVHDSGKIVNPATAYGQVAGGIAQGIGYALLEELETKDGRILYPTFTAYHIPTTLDMPEELGIDFVETRYSGGPYGAKGLGEVPLMASHAAVANAISAATGGRLRQYPATPERVLALLESERA
jgi:CO/xanthine dehydrogenase Mo-binding subunit